MKKPSSKQLSVATQFKRLMKEYKSLSTHAIQSNDLVATFNNLKIIGVRFQALHNAVNNKEIEDKKTDKQRNDILFMVNHVKNCITTISLHLENRYSQIVKIVMDTSTSLESQQKYDQAIECYFLFLQYYYLIHSSWRSTFWKDKSEMGYFCEKIGELYFHQSHYILAVDYHLQSLAWYQDLLDLDKPFITEKVLPQTARIMFMLAQCYSKLGDVHKEIKYYRKTHSTYDQVVQREGGKLTLDHQDLSMWADANHQLGGIFEKQFLYNAALAYYYKEFIILQNIEHETDKLFILCDQIANIYLHIGHYQQAIKWYELQLDYYDEELNPPQELASIKYNLAYAYRHLGQPEQVKNLCLEAIEIFKTVPADERQYLAKQLQECYSLLNNLKFDKRILRTLNSASTYCNYPRIFLSPKLFAPDAKPGNRSEVVVQMFILVEAGNLDNLQNLLTKTRFSKTALLEARDAKQQTVLHVGARQGHTEIITFLLELYENVHPDSVWVKLQLQKFLHLTDGPNRSTGSTAQQLAAQGGHESTRKVLQEVNDRLSQELNTLNQTTLSIAL